MNIDFLRTGGFAGMRLAASVSTNALPEDQATHLKQLIGKAGFFDLPERLVPVSPGPDRFEYKVTITDQSKAHSVEVHEAAAPESLRPLLDYLTTLAMVDRKR
jgi:hypothetical protein